mmetsp:Transcript_59777/g.140720  ORF Transcript_59777/g.140720 Transcript_59777/m.140720 type:complete len:227 (-) Transcript_59777:326-1006(-)
MDGTCCDATSSEKVGSRLNVRRLSSRRRGECVNRAAEIRERVCIRIERHAKAAKQLLHILLRRILFGAEEDGVLKEVSKSLLMVLLIDAASMDFKVHVEATLRFLIREDAVAEPVVEHPTHKLLVTRKVRRQIELLHAFTSQLCCRCCAAKRRAQLQVPFCGGVKLGDPPRQLPRCDQHVATQSKGARWVQLHAVMRRAVRGSRHRGASQRLDRGHWRPSELAVRG